MIHILLYLPRATENDIAKNISFDYLINEFEEKQARKSLTISQDITL